MVRRMALAGAACIAIFAMVPMAPAAAGGGGAGCAGIPATYGNQTRILLKDFCIFPTMARVPVGATITWVNFDEMGHTITGAGGAWGSYKVLNRMDEVSHRFTKSGVYPYFCAFHPGMVGTVVVGDAKGNGGASRTVADVTGKGVGTNDSGKIGVDDVANTLKQTTAKVGAKVRRSPAWPAAALGFSAATGLVGFGFGRRLHTSRDGNGAT